MLGFKQELKEKHSSINIFFSLFRLISELCSPMSGTWRAPKYVPTQNWPKMTHCGPKIGFFFIWNRKLFSILWVCSVPPAAGAHFTNWWRIKTFVGTFISEQYLLFIIGYSRRSRRRRNKGKKWLIDLELCYVQLGIFCLRFCSIVLRNQEVFNCSIFVGDLDFYRSSFLGLGKHSKKCFF